MRLTTLAAQRLLGALKSVDSAEGTKLAAKTRLDIARNINRLMPEVMAYELARNGKARELQAGEAHLEKNNEITKQLEELGNETFEIKLWRLSPEQLNLEDNPRITADMIAALAPILKDFDTTDPEGDS